MQWETPSRTMTLRVFVLLLLGGAALIPWAGRDTAAGNAEPAASKSEAAPDAAPRTVVYRNQLRPIANAKPLLADYPEYVQPVVELRRFEANPILDEAGADLEVRAWRFSYNARGIIEMPNRIRADRTAVIMVHPWGIDDGQGWRTPEPAGVADFCTIEKNHLAGRHTRDVIRPLLNRLRPLVKFTMYSMRSGEKPVHKKVYRSMRHNPTEAERAEGQRALHEILNGFEYKGKPLPAELKLSEENPVRDYFAQFPGLDAGAGYNNEGFWELPTPVCSDVEMQPDDIVIYDDDGYPALRDFLKEHGVRHVILTGYATDMCFCLTTTPRWPPFRPTIRRATPPTPTFHSPRSTS